MTPPPLPDTLGVFPATVNGYATTLQLTYLDASVRGLYTGPPVELPWGEPFARAGVHQAGVWDDWLKTAEALTLAGLSGDVDDCEAAIAAAVVALKATPAETEPDYSDLDDAVLALRGVAVALHAAAQPA